ncbi:hypothetical protein GCM10023215_34120 [Pseudonocardia yuanmonensis]|uniref:Uncharacterized protein n=1 Tax=Pseudonocardia yuanmonensis TaxID=1095914 RepID=A0ABP8WT96_9PSEU
MATGASGIPRRNQVAHTSATVGAHHIDPSAVAIAPGLAEHSAACVTSQPQHSRRRGAGRSDRRARDDPSRHVNGTLSGSGHIGGL